MKVPFGNLTYGVAEQLAVASVLKEWPSTGKVEDAFEVALEEYLGTGVHVALVNTGSSALMAALIANGVKAGDTVLVPDFTYVATASVPAMLGCKVVPVDADPETFDVHPPIRREEHEYLLYTDIAGLPAGWFSDHRAGVIEDGAEALGAEMNAYGKIGNWSHLTIFSFQATKQLPTVEGGAIASRNEELIERCKEIADYGRSDDQYVHTVPGMNMRMTDIQAALGLIQLAELDDHIKRRNEVANAYRKEIPQLTFQKVPSYVSRHAYYAVIGLAGTTVDKEILLDKLSRANIDARRPWTPIHEQPFFNGRGLNYPVSDDIWHRGIMLPIWNDMAEEALDYVIKVANS